MKTHSYTYEMRSDRSGGSPSSFSKTSKKMKPAHDIEEEGDIEIDYDQLVTEDDEPVDNLFSERQQHLFIDSIYASWKRDKPFLASSNVGIYEKIPTTPIVPDAFLSLDVKPAKNVREKRHRCYMIGIFGKPPELAIEVVSNKIGGEKTQKKLKYARMGIKYYVIYDPERHIYKRKLHAFVLKGQSYHRMTSNDSKCWLDDIELGLVIQEGVYDQMPGDWLRWYDKDGTILKTGQELAHTEIKNSKKEKKRAEKENKRAEKEKMRAEKEKMRAEKEKIRAEKEKIRAESESTRAELEKQRADLAEKELEKLKKLLADQTQQAH